MFRPGRKGVVMEGLMVPTTIRRRGYSSFSSSSSRIYSHGSNKRAILMGKNRKSGLGRALRRSRPSTLIPWTTAPSRSAIDSPKYSQSGKSTQPVSARRLAATLWGMSKIPWQKTVESNMEPMKRRHKKNGSEVALKGEQMQAGWGLLLASDSGSGSSPRHPLDPSHSSAVSGGMYRSGSAVWRTTKSASERVTSADQNVGIIDSISHANFMEIQSRSRAQTSNGSVVGCGNRLKDVSNALTTSEELLKIISRICSHADQPSSSMSLVSALHAELERARRQVHQLIQEKRSDRNEINSLEKCFAEEAAWWKNKKQQAIEAAIGSIARELEVERNLSRRLESSNKELGKELVEMKLSFMKAVEELEFRKRSRELTEHVRGELARNIDDGRAEKEKLRRVSFKVHEEVEKERLMVELAGKLPEERVQIKLSGAKDKFEEKSSALTKLWKQLGVFLGTKRENR